jgi:hypothetical protein
MDLQEEGYDGIEWIELVQDTNEVAGTCDCGNEPSGSIKYEEFFDWLRTG